MIEGDAGDLDFHIAAIPSRPGAEAAALFGGKLAAPAGQRVPPIVHRALEGGVAADRAGLGGGVRGRRDQVRSGRTFDGLRPRAGGRAAGIDHQEQEPAQFDRFGGFERTIGSGGGHARNGEPGEAVIVDHAAVEQLDVAHLTRAITRHGVGKEPQERRRIRIVADALHPFRQRHGAFPRKALNDHGRENHRHGRGGRDGE